MPKWYHHDMDEVRFNAAVARALLRKREGGGIGMLGEKTLHSALKFYYEPNVLSHEQKTLGYFADVKIEEGIIEVQTGSLGALRYKITPRVVMANAKEVDRAASDIR